jgi:UDP-galactopyranose mutase
MKSKILIVGAGFSGAVVARELADNGYDVDVIDTRNHIAGNAFDYINEHGIRVHKYGPHLFHTSNQDVVNWLSRFTSWVDYKHKVKALLSSGQYVTLPVNRETTEIVGEANVVDVFFRPYTKKMWGIDIEKLDPEILLRVPIRNDDNEYYFPKDSFQALPKNGYTNLFENILDHPNIKISLNLSFQREMEKEYSHIFNSMPIDAYFNYSIGELPYRSIRFHTFSIPAPGVLPVATVNFTHNEPFTRVTEWSKLPNSISNRAYTTLTFEEPCDYRENQMERYYPVKDIEGTNISRYKKYKSMTPNNMTFIGRCGLYAYLDMHQAINSSLSTVRNFITESNRQH